MPDLIRYLRDQRGAETLEWMLIGGLIVAMGVVLFPGVFGPALSGAVGLITDAIIGK